jgi:polypeptide N-acetylgalactosaminyltransferase
LKAPLEEHLKQFGGKVRLVRNSAREGLIRTRTNGAVAARGDVVCQQYKSTIKKQKT